jgi:cytochrome c-type biogenesis protein CcmH/NrfF
MVMGGQTSKKTSELQNAFTQMATDMTIGIFEQIKTFNSQSIIIFIFDRYGKLINKHQ